MSFFLNFAYIRQFINFADDLTMSTFSENYSLWKKYLKKCYMKIDSPINKTKQNDRKNKREKKLRTGTKSKKST